MLCTPRRLIIAACFTTGHSHTPREVRQPPQGEGVRQPPHGSATSGEAPRQPLPLGPSVSLVSCFVRFRLSPVSSSIACGASRRSFSHLPRTVPPLSCHPLSMPPHVSPQPRSALVVQFMPRHAAMPRHSPPSHPSPASQHAADPACCGLSHAADSACGLGHATSAASACPVSHATSPSAQFRQLPSHEA